MDIARHLVFVAFYSLFGCSGQTIISNIPAPKDIPISNRSIPIVETTNENPVKGIGVFTNVKSDGEHQWGYSVDLWRQDDKIYGLVSGRDNLRLIGDPPTGLLENVQFDPKTGRLSFIAKLSLGLFSNKVYGDFPSRDVYDFAGILTARQLRGNLKVTNELCPDKCPKRKRISLRRSNDNAGIIPDYPSYREWQTDAQEILNFRGPKW